MKKFFKFLALNLSFLLALWFGLSGVLADSFAAWIPITVYNNSTNVYGAIPVLASVNNSQLRNLGYLNSTGLNSNLVEGSTNIGYMLESGRMGINGSSFGAYQSRVYDYRLNNSPGRGGFPIITGYGGNYTIEDDPSIEPQPGMSIFLNGYLNPSYKAGKSILYKPDAFSLNISASGEASLVTLGPGGISSNITSGVGRLVGLVEGYCTIEIDFGNVDVWASDYFGTASDYVMVDGNYWDSSGDWIVSQDAFVYLDSVTFEIISSYPKPAPPLGAPTIIATKAQLQNINLDLDGYYQLGANIDASGVWTSLGAFASPFTGYLDGNGYTISNGNANKPLFESVSGGTVVDTQVANWSINSTSVGVSAIFTIYSIGSTFYNCHVLSGTVGISSTGGDFGGFVEEVWGGGAFYYCSSNVNIFYSTPLGDVGGFVCSPEEVGFYYCTSYGSIYCNVTAGVGGFSSWPNDPVSFRGCRSDVDIYFNAVGYNTEVSAGGFVTGLNANPIYFEDCHSYGDMTFNVGGSTRHDINAGGFTSSSLWGATFLRCSYSGSIGVAITGANVYPPYVGGFIGYRSYNELFNSCWSTGVISVNSTATYTYPGLSVGGFLGRGITSASGASITDCFSRSDIRVSCNTTLYVGGFCGDASVFPAQVGHTFIDSCYSAGPIVVVGGGGGVTSGFASFSGSSVNVTSVRACTWDTVVSGVATSGLATGNVTSWMKYQSNFVGAGWDFNYIWGLKSYKNDGYPYIYYSLLWPALVSTDLVQHEPITMLLDSTIPDRTGNGNLGYINWGTNPSGIEVSIGGIFTNSTYIPPAKGPPDIFLNVTEFNPDTGLYIYENTTATGANLQLYDLFQRAGVSLGWTPQLTYGLIAFLIPSIVMAFAVTVATGNIIAGIGMGVVMMGMAAGTGLLAPWLPFAILALGIMVYFIMKRM